MTVTSDREASVLRSGGGEAVPTALTTPNGQLDRADDADLLAMIRKAPPGSRDRNAACETLVRRYQFLVRLCAQRYRGCPEPLEELMQVGYVGLIKAINNFNPALGRRLRPYAEPCIRGEIKRYFRDRRWNVSVPRSTKDLRLELRASREELAQQLVREPDDVDLSRYIGVSPEDLVEARRADRVFEACSLDAPLSEAAGGQLSEILGSEDNALELVLDSMALWKHWLELPEREQRLLALRFFGDMTQTEIGKRLGISQMQVSRLLERALGRLREQLMDRTRTDGQRPRGPRHRTAVNTP